MAVAMNLDELVSLGEKAVIAGGVIGRQESYHVAGNAKIIHNQDESRKIILCSICGRRAIAAETFICQTCGQSVCLECFVRKRKMCTKCSEQILNREAAFVKEIRLKIETGSADDEMRGLLSTMMTKYGIPEARANELRIDVDKQIKKEEKRKRMRTARIKRENAEDIKRHSEYLAQKARMANHSTSEFNACVFPAMFFLGCYFLLCIVPGFWMSFLLLIATIVSGFIMVIFGFGKNALLGLGELAVSVILMILFISSLFKNF